MKIKFKESAGICRKKEPVSFGLPFPMGKVKDLSGYCFLDKAGGGIPQDETILSLWPDRSVKWALFDVQISVGANACESFELSPQKRPLIKEVDLVQNQDVLEINTGLQTSDGYRVGERRHRR